MNVWFFVVLGVVLMVVALRFAGAHLAARKPPQVGKYPRQLADEPTEPCLPDRAAVEAILTQRFPEQAAALLAQYDRLVKAIASQSFASEELAAAFSDKIGGGSLGGYLCDLAAHSQGELDASHIRRLDLPPSEQRAAA